MKEKQRYYIFTFGVTFCVLIFSAILFNKKPEGFTLGKIHSPFEKCCLWNIEELPAYEKQEVKKILSQDFNYLGSGAQCYAFQSADGDYVLKFFKMKHLIPKKWLKLIPLPWLAQYRFNKIDKRVLRQHELFTSYKIAYEELKEETGMVYIHLNKSKDFGLKVKLFDRMRNCFTANLDDYEFILQKRAQLVHDRIRSLIQKGKREEVVEVIHQLLSHVVLQCKKGFIDRDSGISHNYGFVGDKVVHFDAGRVAQDENAKNPAFYQREILRVGKKLETWFEIHYPAFLPDLEEVIDAMIEA
ncbi:MAG: hypothetical protein P0S96_08290 [Simkaniaceae bacterium]|nr:hypothetical protein [Candidatus Sacchlamyda saccharinae]